MITENPLLVRCPKCRSTRERFVKDWDGWIRSVWSEEEQSDSMKHECKDCGEIYIWKIIFTGEEEEYDPNEM